MRAAGLLHGPLCALTTAHARRVQAAKAMRLVAIAQQLAALEASAQPAAHPPRRLAARHAAPIVEQSDGPSDADDDAADDDEDADCSDPEPLSRGISPRRCARGLQVR